MEDKRKQKQKSIEPAKMREKKERRGDLTNPNRSDEGHEIHFDVRSESQCPRTKKKDGKSSERSEDENWKNDLDCSS